eukprot:1150725-Pelagomonas_calceolata.AAC.9
MHQAHHASGASRIRRIMPARTSGTSCQHAHHASGASRIRHITHQAHHASGASRIRRITHQAHHASGTSCIRHVMHQARHANKLFMHQGRHICIKAGTSRIRYIMQTSSSCIREGIYRTDM